MDTFFFLFPVFKRIREWHFANVDYLVIIIVAVIFF